MYAFQRMDKHPTVSVWVLVIHEKLAAMSITDTDLVDRIAADQPRE